MAEEYNSRNVVTKLIQIDWYIRINLGKFKKYVGGWLGVTVIVVDNEIGDSRSKPDETVCIQFYSNIFGKGMNPSLLLSVIGKY